MTKDKATSAPLPGARHAQKRGDALRGNLGKRKQQTRARENAPAEKNHQENK